MARPRPNADTRPTIQRTAYLNAKARKQMEGDIALCEHQLEHSEKYPDLDERLVSQRRDRLRNSFYAQAPPEIDGEKRTNNARRIKVLNKEIAVGMLSEEEMRRCPSGAVDRNTKWMRDNSGRIQERRNLLIENEPDNEDSSYLSVDHNLRAGIATTMSMHDCRIKGQEWTGGVGPGANSPEFNANIDKILGDIDRRVTDSTELQQKRTGETMQAEEIQELRAMVERLSGLINDPERGERKGL